MALINTNELDGYLKDNYNVLFEGRHGVGKTAMVKNTFERAGYRWLYFSASTMDPWVDLVGVPKPQTLPDGTEVLDLVRPRWVIDDSIDAIFFDELNRAPEKVLNAVMELIQFKSINGRKLNRLKVIWGAINPYDEETTYHVTRLDPAQRDRFHVLVKVPYEVDADYFKARYPQTADAFIAWWKQLPEDIRTEVSPRRLDYAAEAYAHNRSLERILPHKSNIAALKRTLVAQPFAQQLRDLKTQAQIELFLKDSNNVVTLLQLVQDPQPNVDVVRFLQKYSSSLPQELVQALTPPAAAERVKKKDSAVAVLKQVVSKFSDPGDKVNNEMLAHSFVPGDIFVAEIARDPQFDLKVELINVVSELKLSKLESYKVLSEHLLNFLNKASVDELEAMPQAIIQVTAAVITIERPAPISFLPKRAEHIKRRLMANSLVSSNVNRSTVSDYIAKLL